MKMDDLGIPLFSETPKSWHENVQIHKFLGWGYMLGLWHNVYEIRLGLSPLPGCQWQMKVQVRIPYKKYNNPGGDCYWAGGQPKICRGLSRFMDGFRSTPEKKTTHQWAALLLRASENPLVSLNKAGYETLISYVHSPTKTRWYPARVGDISTPKEIT